MKPERFANTPVRAEPVEALSRTSPTLRHGDFDKLSPLLRANGRMFHASWVARSAMEPLK